MCDVKTITGEFGHKSVTDRDTGGSSVRRKVEKKSAKQRKRKNVK